MASSSSQPVTRRPKILVAATGCIAAENLGLICKSLQTWADVEAIVTKNAESFYVRNSLPPGLVTNSDDIEQILWGTVSKRVLHIQLREWADMLLIAPLSSNTLAKIRAGICDNLLTSTVKAWDIDKPLLIAPAMSPAMWKNALTEEHLCFVEDELKAIHIRHDSDSLDPAPMATVSIICNKVHEVWLERKDQPRGIN